MNALLKPEASIQHLLFKVCIRNGKRQTEGEIIYSNQPFCSKYGQIPRVQTNCTPFRLNRDGGGITVERGGVSATIERESDLKFFDEWKVMQ